MSVLIACEESQTVCCSMRSVGISAFSCDIEDCSGGHPEWHLKGDLMNILYLDWDAIIAFPPCTYLCSSGMHWTVRGKRPRYLTDDAIAFVQSIWTAPCPLIAIENPVGVLSTSIRKPDQIIQPWMFGHDASKKTCLWLKGLPPLIPTNIVVKERYANQTPSGQNKLGPSPSRARERAKTYQGIADAMATQWKPYITGELT